MYTDTNVCSPWTDIILKPLVYEISTKKKKLICLTYHKAQNYLKHREKNSTFKRLHTKTV